MVIRKLDSEITNRNQALLIEILGLISPAVTQHDFKSMQVYLTVIKMTNSIDI